MNKKKLGIIGGMGSRAGAFFLKKIIDYSPADTDQDFLEIIFHNNSAIPDRTKAIVYSDRSPLNDILKSIDMFNKNKVDVIALGCITSYYYYKEFSAHTAAEVINPLFLIADHIKEKHMYAKRIGVLATTGTISTGLFHKELECCNAEVVTLNPKNQEEFFMQSVYMKNGFKSAKISKEAEVLMEKSINKLIDLDVDLIIGGCTEVSIAIDRKNISVPYIDVLDLLAQKTVNFCYNLDVVNI